ncbi:lipase maturation factor family protein [Hyalangium rubrum]|uniref:Lipase maturation factor 2 n=1 Tax=Hyalangium rubrum TaxID=3103134 RepID=A0ABU5HAI3_9BACT|nr:lipase maturation factor family protein [Hyalangium sp. s54d21]MDY7230492.1 lipase maturation factor family protein [Hyalangium sp. s54d21]
MGERRSLARVRWVYLRGLGLVFCLAFASLLPQLSGLLGPEGLEPAAGWLEWGRVELGAERFLRVPTLLWLFGASSLALQGVCVAGLVCGGLLVANVAPRWALVGAWACYLSLTSLGGSFLSFQWDVLLLEVALVSLPLAPGHLRPPGSVEEPRRGAMLLVRLLLARLMFMSGVVKLVSGDATWRNLTALEFHYWTQPLPNAFAYFVHQLPAALQRASVAGMLAIELGAPLFLFAPRPFRLAAGAALALLQVGILATGNYGFFNLLSLVLCLSALDDGVLARWRVFQRLTTVPAPPPRHPRARAVAFVGFAAVYALLGLSLDVERGAKVTPPAPVSWTLDQIAGLRSVNTYGLFAVMTTERREILIEGSDDGQTWREYLLKWRPGSVDEMPRFVAPHQPRLDWQMWFAALSVCENNPWLLRLQQKLLEGAPGVRGFFREGSFPASPPRYVRTRLFDYHFTDFAQWRATGDWWTRRELGLYCPPLTLSQGRLMRADRPAGR